MCLRGIGEDLLREGKQAFILDEVFTFAIDVPGHNEGSQEG